MGFRVSGLALEPFAPLIGASDAALERIGALRCVVDANPGSPCRITLDDAEVGETVILLSYEHQPAATAYRQAGPIFIREAAEKPFGGQNAIPPALARRMLSLRAYDDAGVMGAAALIDGASLADAVAALFAEPTVAYVHAHYALRGCFAARIDRD